MKVLSLFSLFLSLNLACFSQEATSAKNFDPVALVNKIDFINPKYDQPKFACGFLLLNGNDTFAVTAKHLLKHIKSDGMMTVSLDNQIRLWSMYSLTNTSETVSCDALLNENKTALLDAKSTYEEDWLVFSIKNNQSKVRPLIARTTPLIAGEKLYVVGWTRTMETGPQRVYEFTYYKTIGNKLLLEEVIVPEKFGGLSGAPVLDEQGLVVGIVSGGTVDPETDKKYFAPCSITGVISFLAGRK